MGWRLFQIAVVIAVIWTSIYLELPGGMLPGMFGCGLAFVLTIGLSKAFDAWRYRGVPKAPKPYVPPRSWRGFLLGGD